MASSSTVETVGEESRTVRTEDDWNGDAESIAEAPPAGTDDLPNDVVFGLLSAARRRSVLRHLKENDGGATIGEVAEHIGAAENGIEVHQLSSTQRKRTYVGLYQNHLPKLNDANVIDYDRARGTIELREGAEQLLPYLSLDSADAGEDESQVEFSAPTWLGALPTKLWELVPF